uniref:Uncharacterized protein LOC100180449 n=1 Tax=Phallusia mammillata TaxID=59560 RepID=A0A6F9DHZ9_9ASCI|nr:uncharacterized protein LOC100180449 [Phallusia mammillata]
MKTLFNILDDAGVGLVPLTEIERRWRDDAVPNLPGVLDCLRSVAPSDGLLSFETFVWGLRTALARARQCRERNSVDAQNLKNTFKTSAIENNADVLPPYYYQRKPTAKGKPLLTSKVGNIFRQNNGRNIAGSDSEGLRSESYAPYSTPPAWSDEMNQGRYAIGSYQEQAQKSGGFPSNDLYHQNRSSGRAFKGHRRSNSGPISTAKVLPSPKRTVWPGDMGSREEGKITKMGYATKFSAQPVKSESSDKENDDYTKPDLSKEFDEIKYDSSGDKSSLSLKSEPTSDKSSFEKEKSLSNSPNTDQSSQLSEKSDLDLVTANTLFISTDNQTSLNKPIGLSGKYIGITGTLQRAKSAAAIPNHYGSLRRPAMSTKSTVSSASESCFSPTDFDAYRQKNSLRFHKKKSPSPTLLQQYASAGESGDDSHKRVLRHQPKSPDNTNEHAGSDGAGRRCNSASPPDRSSHKGIRRPLSPEARDCHVTPVVRKQVELTNRPKSTSPEGQGTQNAFNQTSSGKSTAHVTVFMTSQENKPTNTSGEGNYATVGRRRTSASKRRDPRRHTVTNGIDYSVLKCMKLLEQEKDLVLQGMDTLDRGREWFQVRLCGVQERQRQMSTANAKPRQAQGVDNDMEVTQGRLDEMLTKISQLTKLVNEIAESRNKNKDSNSTEVSSENPLVVSALREQNHVLTREVARQSEKISQLEHEKSVLVQQLFQAKAEAQRVDGQANTSIFI